MNNRTAWIMVVILALFGAIIAGFDVGITRSIPQALPSFLDANGNGYSITFRDGQCVRQITMHPAEGGMWAQDGNSECPRASSDQYQALINQAITEHKATCLAFSPNLNGTMTFSYSTEPLCGDPWHSIVVSKP